MTTVILLGASTRAAATSARRAGWTPWCADLFADADLERIATVHRVPSERYPHGLIDALTEAPPGPVIYTGALENRPELIAKIERPLWGNAPAVLRAVRDPVQWRRALREADLPCPALSFRPQADGRWLHKPIRSGGGIGITPYIGGEVKRGAFLQQWRDGGPVSGLFLGCDDGAILLGVSRQLVGTPWLNATSFHYAGNIGPMPIDETPWRHIGTALVERFRLRGLFGVDAILHDGVPWPVEINPRYTASVEIFERAWGAALLPLHRDCFLVGRARLLPSREPAIDLAANNAPGGFGSAGASPSRIVGGKLAANNVPDGSGSAGASPSRIVGKAVLYARRAFTFPSSGPWVNEAIDFADVPHAGQRIEERHPVLTIFAQGASVDECADRLREKAQALDRALWG